MKSPKNTFLVLAALVSAPWCLASPVLPSNSFASPPSGNSPSVAEAITPEIRALARGLDNDPQRIFNYVRDQIAYRHYFGSKKGAQLTLIEKSGNDFDQCALLVAILRAAGQTASYRFGTVSMPYDAADDRDFKHWLALTKANTNWTETGSFVASLNASRGLPFLGAIPGDENDLVLHRAWVELSIGEDTYALDPAFKVHRPVPGINLIEAMGYSSNAIYSAVGGVSYLDYAQNLSEAGLGNKLRDYTTNLLACFQSNYPNATVEEIIGGQRAESGQNFGDSLPFTPFPWTNNMPAVEWQNIPTNLITTLTVSVDGTNWVLFMPELQGQRLSLSFNSTNRAAQFWLEDRMFFQARSNSQSTATVSLKVDHPHGEWDWANNTLVDKGWNDASRTNTYLRANASYAISYCFEPSQESLLRRQRKLDEYRDQGLADSSRQVVTETLNIMGLNWLLQTERISRLVAAQQGVSLQQHHRFVGMGQESGQGFYLEPLQQDSGMFPSSGNSRDDLTRAHRVFEVANYFASAAAHAALEQLQSNSPAAASAVKMLGIGNRQGEKTYLATRDNWSRVYSGLVNQETAFLKTNYIDRGYSLLLPANGSNLVAGVGSYAGYGFVAQRVTLEGDVLGLSMGLLLAGGFEGACSGLSSASISPSFVSQWNCSQPGYFDPVAPGVRAYSGAARVGMADGSFQLTSTDLAAGQPAGSSMVAGVGEQPQQIGTTRGIIFTRYYNSNRRRQDLVGMGPGWVHNYYAKAVDVSAPLPEFSCTTPAQIAPLIVAAKSAIENYNPNGTPKNWLVTSFMAKWAADQLTTNAVCVTLGKDEFQFLKQPDGALLPPPAANLSLTRKGSQYWLRNRHGSTYKFDHTGSLTNIIDQHLQELRVTWSNDLVSRVIDWKGRHFTFLYTDSPSRLTVISNATESLRRVFFNYAKAATNSQRSDLVSVADPERKTNYYTYDRSHQIVRMEDAIRRTILTNVYDSLGRVMEQQSQGDSNRTWRLYWSGAENIEEDPAGGRTIYSYDGRKRLVSRQDPLGHRTTWTYDAQNRLLSEVRNTGEASEERTSFSWDARDNLVAVVDPLGRQKTFIYDRDDNLVQARDERGNTNAFAYNSRFQLIACTNAAGDWVTYDYSPVAGALLAFSNAGGSTALRYDDFAQLSEITYPNNLGTERFVNDARGDVLAHTDPRGFVTSFRYNLRRELTNTIAPTNLACSVFYDPAGNKAAMTDGRGFALSHSWSATHKLLTTTLPAVPEGLPLWQLVYDTRDTLARIVDSLKGISIYSRDAAGLLTGITDALGRTTRYGYDGAGRRTAETNAAGEATLYTWNARGELIKVIDPAGRIIGQEFDEAGNLVRLTNRNGKVWQFEFDAVNRLKRTVSPAARETRQSWNQLGLLASLTEPSGEHAEFFYDSRCRLTNRTDAAGTAYYQYDPNNNLTSVAEGGRTNRWTFDAYNRVSSYADADGNLVRYSYDANGNLIGLVYPGGKTVSYSYDSLNRVTNVTDWAGRRTTMQYDLASRLRKLVRPNGTVREISYDAAGQATNIVERTGANTLIAFYKYGWNNAGGIAWQFAVPLPQAYTAPSRTMTYDDDNRILTFNGQAVAHDPDGNLTGGPIASSTFVGLTYNPRNQLMSAAGVTYAYGPAGNRVALSTAAGVTGYLSDPHGPIPQVLIRTRPDGSRTYCVHGGGLLYEVNETAGGVETTTTAYHYDHRGNTIALTDDAAQVTDRIEYSPYGLVTYRSGANDTPFLFRGREGALTDPNGLVCVKGRYYSAYLARFVNADPAGFAHGLNFYAYAEGDPIGKSQQERSVFAENGSAVPRVGKTCRFLDGPESGVDQPSPAGLGTESNKHRWIGLRPFAGPEAWRGERSPCVGVSEGLTGEKQVRFGLWPRFASTGN